ncbi:MAG: RNA pseudouridine synthase [Spirochaetales bacterium]|nr:MAG: RNA pseudouridine synthase [Spirochaetales bacterium]
MLYSDDDILIIDKPSGLAVQPGAGVRISVLEAVERDYGFRPFLVHRLDRETAGALVLARSPRSAAALSGIMEERRAIKLYRAVVIGVPDPAEGLLEGDVRVKGAPVSARTRYRLIDQAKGFSLVEAELGTGRMHQIRQHFAAAGWPILADDRHGNFRANKAAAREYGAKRLFLYAWRLVLPFGRTIDVTASIPPHFADFFVRTGLGASVAGTRETEP